jgi:hypothetical protein
VTLKVRNVRRALKAKGFHEEDRDHHYYFLQHQGKLTPIHTKISHGETDLYDGLCSQMARQMRLTTAQFRQFVDCTLTSEGYVGTLISAGHLETSNPPEL